MDHFDKDLQELIAKGKSQGYLTYDEVNAYLPDEAVSPEKLDNLLIALEEQGIELGRSAARARSFAEEPPSPATDGGRTGRGGAEPSRRRCRPRTCRS